MTRQADCDRNESSPRYTLRRARTHLMIDKSVPDPDFDPPLWVRVASFGPFATKDRATAFMVRHGDRP